MSIMPQLIVLMHLMQRDTFLNVTVFPDSLLRMDCVLVWSLCCISLCDIMRQNRSAWAPGASRSAPIGQSLLESARNLAKLHPKMGKIFIFAVDSEPVRDWIVRPILQFLFKYQY